MCANISNYLKQKCLFNISLTKEGPWPWEVDIMNITTGNYLVHVSGLNPSSDGVVGTQMKRTVLSIRRLQCFDCGDFIAAAAVSLTISNYLKLFFP